MNVEELRRLVASLRNSAFIHYDEGEHECDYGLAADMLEALARRVIAAEKLVEALKSVPLGDGEIGRLLTAYEATK